MVGNTTRISPVKPPNTEIKTTELDENLDHGCGPCPGTSIKSDGVKLVLWAQASPLSEMMRV